MCKHCGRELSSRAVASVRGALAGVARSSPHSTKQVHRIAKPQSGIAEPVGQPGFRASPVERPTGASGILKSFLLLGLVVLIIYIVIASGTSGGDTAESPPPPAVPAASQPTQGGSDVCSWFVATQMLRAQRIGGLSGLATFMQTHDLNNMSETEIQQFVDILVRYQPYQREFIQAWEELGPNLDASPFWEKEWESVQLRILAFGDINRAYQQNDAELLLDGLDKFFSSQQVGLEAEAAMMNVRSSCIN